MHCTENVVVKCQLPEIIGYKQLHVPMWVLFRFLHVQVSVVLFVRLCIAGSFEIFSHVFCFCFHHLPKYIALEDEFIIYDWDLSVVDGYIMDLAFIRTCF